MFFEKKHPIKADADLTNRMLRILATGNGNRLQKCLKTMFFEKNTRLLTKSSQNSLIIFTLQAQKKQFISFFFFLSKKPSNLQDFAVDVSDRHRRGFTSSLHDDVRLVENLKNLPGFLSYFASKNKQFMPQYLAIFKQS